jgi:hypothetical protein
MIIVIMIAQGIQRRNSLGFGRCLGVECIDVMIREVVVVVIVGMMRRMIVYLHFMRRRIVMMMRVEQRVFMLMGLSRVVGEWVVRVRRRPIDDGGIIVKLIIVQGRGKGVMVMVVTHSRSGGCKRKSKERQQAAKGCVQTGETALLYGRPRAFRDARKRRERSFGGGF